MSSKLSAKFALVACTAVAALASAHAYAGSLTASLNSVGGGGVGPYTSNLDVRFSTSSGGWDTYNNALIGQLNWTNVKVPGSENIAFTPSDAGYGFFQTGQNFSSWCIEGTQNVYAPGTANFVTTTLANGSRPDNVAANIVNGLGAQRASWITEFYNKNIGSVTDNASAAGFQMGIWAIIYDANATTGDMSYFALSNTNKFTSISSNHFQVLDASLSYHNGVLSGTDAGLLWAAKMLANVTGGAYTQNYSLVALTDNTYQDQIVAVPAPVATPNAPTVPLPAALPGGVMLLGGMVARKIARRRKNDIV